MNDFYYGLFMLFQFSNVDVNNGMACWLFILLADSGGLFLFYHGIMSSVKFAVTWLFSLKQCKAVRILWILPYWWWVF